MSKFEDSVCQALKLIPKGKVTTYKILAAYLNRPKAARAVGNALHKNSDPVTMPCYKVVKSDGHLGGYASGIAKKIDLLKADGIIVKNNKIINLAQHLYSFKR
jgi:O-6-methylguanine DNA methyltransferase